MTIAYHPNADMPANTVLQSAIDSKLDQAFVAGYDAKGQLYLASTMNDAAQVLLLLERAKLYVIKQDSL